MQNTSPVYLLISNYFMQMKKLLFFLLVTITCTVYAQNDLDYVNIIVNQKMAELEMQDTPEYFFRNDYCDGNIEIFKLRDGKICSSNSTYYAVYVFWKEDENTLNIQKFDNCGSFKPFTIVVTKAMARALKDKEKLMYEDVLPYKAEKVDDNAFGNMSVQSCHKNYKFVFDNKVFEKSFNQFDLTNESKYKNLNAAHNNSLALIKLDNEISEIVKNLEINGKFFREN
ncbi:hypothetical protein Aeqsu_2962 [Aequorivita sublithincola DSM 14238]|uniref:Uncharacterized protein n=2 Tax=Aequorivita TaxID=153265 RepID=I3YZI5_AEQSU|nr:hypothetical protein Aeqsu_2962 [Aequorivita sublithincola DSM 14238]